MQQARLLSLALTDVLAKLNQDYESLFNSLKASSGAEVISIQVDGGGFKEE